MFAFLFQNIAFDFKSFCFRICWLSIFITRWAFSQCSMKLLVLRTGLSNELIQWMLSFEMDLEIESFFQDISFTWREIGCCYYDFSSLGMYTNFSSKCKELTHVKRVRLWLSVAVSDWRPSFTNVPLFRQNDIKIHGHCVQAPTNPVLKNRSDHFFGGHSITAKFKAAKSMQNVWVREINAG